MSRVARLLSLILPVLVGGCAAITRPPARPAVALDHLFVLVPTGAEAAVRALETAGFVVEPGAHPHRGQGTASRTVLFENAYLELLYVDPSVRLDDDRRPNHARFQRATAWRESGTSPFGIALRRVADDTLPLGVPVQRNRAAWMRPGSAMEFVLGSEEASRLFVVPAYMAMPSWVDSVRRAAPALFAHASGARRVTRAMIRGPASLEPEHFRVIAPGTIAFARDSVPVLVLELDGGVRRKTLDLRPATPLVLRY